MFQSKKVWPVPRGFIASLPELRDFQERVSHLKMLGQRLAIHAQLHLSNGIYRHVKLLGIEIQRGDSGLLEVSMEGTYGENWMEWVVYKLRSLTLYICKRIREIAEIFQYPALYGLQATGARVLIANR